MANDKGDIITIERKLMGKIFRSWRFYFICKLARRRNLRKSIFFRKIQVEQRCLNALLIYSKRKKLSKNNCKAMTTSEIKREQKNFTIKKYSKQDRDLLRKCWKLWLKSYRHALECQKIEFQIAENHYTARTLRRIFIVWAKFSKKKIREAKLLDEARDYSRTKMLKVCMERIRSNFVVRRREKLLTQKAEIYFTNQLVQKCLVVWIKYHREKKKYEENIIFFQEHMKEKIQRIFFSIWRDYIFEKKCSKRKKFLSINYFNGRVIRKCFSRLNDYMIYRKRKQKYIAGLKDASCKIFDEFRIRYVEKWRITMVCAIRERQKNCLAIQKWESLLFKRYFKCWKIFSHEHRAKSVYKKNLYEIGTTISKKQYILLWSEKYRILKSKESEMMKVYLVKMKQRLFKSWRDYTARKIQERDIEEIGRNHRDNLMEPKTSSLQMSSRLVIPDFMRDNIDKIENFNLASGRFNSYTNNIGVFPKRDKIKGVRLLPPSAFHKYV